MPNTASAAGIEQLEDLMDFVVGHARAAGFPMRRIRAIELAAEEVLVNIFRHAFPGRKGDVQVEVRTEGDVALVVEISDDGAPFNILDVPDPDVTAGINVREVGGLGAFFVRKMTDDAQYRREGGRNVLMLVFRKAQESAKEQKGSNAMEQ